MGLVTRLQLALKSYNHLMLLGILHVKIEVLVLLISLLPFYLFDPISEALHLVLKIAGLLLFLIQRLLQDLLKLLLLFQLFLQFFHHLFWPLLRLRLCI